MNYELALKLKDNKFPQTGRSHEWYLEENKELLINPIMITVNTSVCVPTLSELIEACEDTGVITKVEWTGDDDSHEVETRCECVEE